MASSSRYLLQGNPSQLNPARFASRACVPSQRNGASARAAWSPASELNQDQRSQGWQVVVIPDGRVTHLGCGGRCVAGELQQSLTNREYDTPKLSRALAMHCLLDLHKAIRQPRVPTRDQQQGCRGDGLNRAGVLVQALQDSSHGGGSEQQGGRGRTRYGRGRKVLRD